MLGAGPSSSQTCAVLAILKRTFAGSSLSLSLFFFFPLLLLLPQGIGGGSDPPGYWSPICYGAFGGVRSVCLRIRYFPFSLSLSLSLFLSLSLSLSPSLSLSLSLSLSFALLCFAWGSSLSLSLPLSLSLSFGRAMGMRIAPHARAPVAPPSGAEVALENTHTNEASQPRPSVGYKAQSGEICPSFGIQIMLLHPRPDKASRP